MRSRFEYKKDRMKSKKIQMSCGALIGFVHRVLFRGQIIRQTFNCGVTAVLARLASRITRILLKRILLKYTSRKCSQVTVTATC